jgi:hypothetical protein
MMEEYIIMGTVTNNNHHLLLNKIKVMITGITTMKKRMDMVTDIIITIMTMYMEVTTLILTKAQ